MTDNIGVEREMTRGEAADFLREFAAELDHSSTMRGRSASGPAETDTAGGPTESDITGGSTDDEPADTPSESNTRVGPAGGADHGRITLAVGNEATVLLPPERVRFRVETDSGSGLLETGTEQRVDFRLSWDIEEVPESDAFEVK